MQTTDVGPPGAETPPSATRSRLVGAFALLGVLLIVGGLALLNSSRSFGQRRTFVLFFPNPVGLRAGAPVTFRQAPLGEVREVELVFTGRGFESETMVVLDIRRGALRRLRGAGAALQEADDRAFAATLNKAGLRGTVRSSSPVGGSRSLDLDFHPEVEGRLTGIDSPYPELATGTLSRLDILQGKVERVLETVADMPLEETVEQVRATLTSAQALLDNGDLKGALANLRRVLGMTVGLCLGTAALFAFFALAFSGQVLSLYTNDPHVIEAGASILRIVGLVVEIRVLVPAVEAEVLGKLPLQARGIHILDNEGAACR